MRIHLTVKRDEDGAVAIVTALLTVSLIVVAAFTTDFGMAYSQRQAFATGADSAALAVVRAEYNKQLLNLSRDCVTARDTDAAFASGIAFTQVTANKPFNEVVVAGDVDTKLTCESNVLKVRVVVTHKVNPIFGGVAGAGPINVSREATAALGVVTPIGLSPITMCMQQAQAIMDAHAVDSATNPPTTDRALLLNLTKIWGSGTTCANADGNGNWGWLDYGQGNGESQLADMIGTGFSGALTVNPTTPVTYSVKAVPGNRANGSAVPTAMKTLMDKSIILPVYDTVAGRGQNAIYHVIGFLSLKLCGFAPNSLSKKETGNCYDTSVPLAGDDLQVRFVSFTPSGQIGGTGSCPIGQSCAFNAYVTKLLS